MLPLRIDSRPRFRTGTHGGPLPRLSGERARRIPGAHGTPHPAGNRPPAAVPALPAARARQVR